MTRPDPAGRPRQTPAGDPPSTGEATPATRTPAAGRPRQADHELGSAAADTRLRPRDYVIAHLLDEHRTLTTPQLAAVLFDSAATARQPALPPARRRLGGLLHPHPRRRAAAHPLGPRAAVRRVRRPPRRPHPTHARGPCGSSREAIAASAHLEHTDGANQFFIDLLAHTRSHPRHPARRAGGRRRVPPPPSGGAVHPDGHGVWEQDGDQRRSGSGSNTTPAPRPSDRLDRQARALPAAAP